MNHTGFNKTIANGKLIKDGSLTAETMAKCCREETEKASISARQFGNTHECGSSKLV